MIISLIIFLTTLVVKLAIDYRLWLMGKRNQHTRGAIPVIGALLICSWQAGWLSAGVWFFGYWILFDGILALLMGEKWFYVGNTAELDIWQNRWPVLKWLKYVFLLISIILYAY